MVYGRGYVETAGQRARVGRFANRTVFYKTKEYKGTTVQGAAPGVSKNSDTFYGGVAHSRDKWKYCRVSGDLHIDREIRKTNPDNDYTWVQVIKRKFLT